MFKLHACLFISGRDGLDQELLAMSPIFREDALGLRISHVNLVNQTSVASDSALTYQYIHNIGT